MFKGTAASQGIVIGPAFVLNKKISNIQKEQIPASMVAEEIERLKKAVEKTKMEILSIKEKIIYDIGNNEADIFNAYLLLLEDPMFAGKTEEIIESQMVNAEYALTMVLKDYSDFFNRISDSYLKERSRDIAGLVEKVVNNLSEKASDEQEKPDDKYIVVAMDLTPADTAEMDKNRILGFITEMGGATSHTAIVARSLEIPAVVGIRDITRNVKTGDLLVVDGEKGIVISNPNQKILAAYKEEQKKYFSKIKTLKRLKKLEPITLDKHTVTLSANIEFPEEVGVVKENNTDGIGLFRTEFIYMNRMNLPNEEEQFNMYKSVVEKMNPKPVTIRTLDIGGDKFLPYFKLPPEQNPFLGLRSIRLSLSNINIFKLQLRAILRASAFGTVKIMFPMISVAGEIDDAKKILDEVKDELRHKKIAFDNNIKTGIMIEVPSAALMSEEFAKKVEFFSLGTNDLIQYTMAVDRGNQSVSHLYDGLNPAVLRLIKMTVDNGHKNKIPVSVCGEMAGEPYISVLLMGMGVDELSTNAATTLTIKKIIRNIKFQDSIEIADKAIRMTKPAEIKAFLTSKINELLLGSEKEEKE